MLPLLLLNEAEDFESTDNLTYDGSSQSSLQHAIYSYARGNNYSASGIVCKPFVMFSIVYGFMFLFLSDDIKVKVAIGFAVTCAVLLFAIFILLLYKVLWFKSRSNASSKSTQRVVSQPRAPSVTERTLKTSRQQRRHAPLMRSDSSVSEIGLDSLSKNNNFSSTSTENSLNLGQLDFEIHYDTDSEVLRVKIVTARNLPANHSTNYVEIYLLPDRVEKHQTKICYSNCNPVYNEEFEFDVGYSELSERTLQCCLFSFDGFSRHQSIGEVFYSFGEDDQFNENTSVSLCKDIKRDLFLLKVSLSQNHLKIVLSIFILLSKTHYLRKLQTVKSNALIAFM